MQKGFDSKAGLEDKTIRDIREAIGGCNESAYWVVLYKIVCDYIEKNGQIYEDTPLTETTNVELQNYVFIIDEINRGEISKIFGELFFAIDPGYRYEFGQGDPVKVETQYQEMIEEGDIFDKGFYIPENLYIIGTMNDIDRSVEAIDFAMHRRFAWKEIKPQDRLEMLDDLGEFKDKAIKRMDNLNAAIVATEGLSEAYQIGPAYFRKLKIYGPRQNEDNAWEELWSNHLESLLREYLRGADESEIKFQKLKEAYNSPL